MSHLFHVSQGETVLESNLKSQCLARQAAFNRDRAAPKGRTGESEDSRKQVFWQTTINYQRPKLKLYLDKIEIGGLADTKTDITIILQVS